MKFEFFNTPKPKKFGYKPQFFDAEKAQNDDPKRSHEQQFAEELHNAWNRKRQRKSDRKSPLRTLIWPLFIIIVLLFFFLKFFR